METPGDLIRNKDKGPDLKSKLFKDGKKTYDKQSKLEREKYLNHIAVEKAAKMNQPILK